MQPLLNRLRKFVSWPWAVPVLLALISILAYGLLLPKMGFYWDDLPISWVRYELGAQALTRYFSNNRPVWGLLYQLTTRLFPQVPIYWQIFALFWRWVTAVLVWAIVARLWPKQTRFAFGVSALFLIYPGFNAQWTAFLYSHFFIVLAFFLFSQHCMLWTIPRPSWKLTLLSLFFSALSLWMMEYFFLLELTRVTLIWLALRDEGLDSSHRFKRTLQLWWPYLALFAAAVFSRLFIFNNQVYGIGLGSRLKTDFVNTLVSLFITALKSMWTVSAAAWAQAFQLPNPAVNGPRTIAIYVVVILVTLAILFFIFWSKAESEMQTKREAWSAVILGLIMLPFASAPFWLTDLPVSLSFPANRSTLPSMFAVSLIAGGLLALIPWMRAHYALLALLIGFAVGRQFLWATDFSRDWDVQKNLFWQMTWRVPGIQPNTLVLMNEGALNFYADNSLSAALTWIYAPKLTTDSGQIPYLLFYPTNRLNGALPSLDKGINLSYDYLVGSFHGSTSQVVSFYYLPPACLRVLDPDIDANNHFIPDQYMMREGAALSSTAWIQTDETAHMPKVYGPEPKHGWCYYFEKADLARQEGDWGQVAQLGDKAFALNDYPNDPSERFVFVEGYAHTGDWQKALDYSIQSHRVSPTYIDPMLCKLWSRIESTTQPSAERESTFMEVRTKFTCLGT